MNDLTLLKMRPPSGLKSSSDGAARSWFAASVSTTTRAMLKDAARSSACKAVICFSLNRRDCSEWDKRKRRDGRLAEDDEVPHWEPPFSAERILLPSRHQSPASALLSDSEWDKGNQLLLPMSWNLAVKLCTGVTNNFRNEGKFWVVTYCFAGLF
jgi:hypothetical protein